MGYEFLANCALLSPFKKKKKGIDLSNKCGHTYQRRGGVQDFMYLRDMS